MSTSLVVGLLNDFRNIASGDDLSWRRRHVFSNNNLVNPILAKAKIAAASNNVLRKHFHVANEILAVAGNCFLVTASVGQKEITW